MRIDMKNISLLLVVLMSGSLFAGIRAATPTPQSTDPSSWWCQRFEKKCIDLKEKGAPLLLIGDDVTQMWEENGKGLQPFRAYLQKEPMSAVSIGYNGDRTENVLWRLQNGELDGYEQPKAAIIMVGANNTLGFSEDEEPPCDTILGIRSIIDTRSSSSPSFPAGALPTIREGPGTSTSTRRSAACANRSARPITRSTARSWTSTAISTRTSPTTGYT